MPRGGRRVGAGRKPKPKIEVLIQPDKPPLPWRPSKYDPSLCDLVIECMKEGFSLTGFAGKIGVSRSTVGEWINEFPDFSVACNVGKAVRAAIWEERAGLVAQRGGGPGTAQVIIFALKNMAPEEYADTQNIRHAGHDGGALKSEVKHDLSGLTDDELAKLYNAKVNPSSDA